MAFQLVQSSDYSDSAGAEQETTGVSAMARPFVHGLLRFMCDGPTVQMRIAAGYGSGTNEGRIAVYVDGVYTTNALPTSASALWYTATIPAGTHLVELAAAQQTGGSYPVVAGTWVDGVQAPNLTILPPASAPNWVIVDSDSIAASLVNVTGQGDWVSLFRVGYAARGRTACYSWGFRGMHTETANHAYVAAQMDRACRGATRIRYVAVLGTNDYGLGLCNAATFGADYAARLAAVRTQFGARLQQLYCVLPFPRQVETANGFGDTLGALRAQISALAGGDRVTIVDGTAMGLIPVTDYTDTPWLHPNDGGHAKIATAMLAAAGGP